MENVIAEQHCVSFCWLILLLFGVICSGIISIFGAFVYISLVSYFVYDAGGETYDCCIVHGIHRDLQNLMFANLPITRP